MCCPGFFGTFLSFCYIFFLVFTAFLDFVVFAFQFPTHFAKFRIGVSQISCVSSILRLFLSILLQFFHNFKMLRSCPFNWIYVALISLYFVQVLCRFNVFNQENLTHSAHQAQANLTAKSQTSKNE